MKNNIRVKNIKKFYPANKNLFKKSYIQAVDNVSFDIKEGEILGLIGESGCGKSTLGRVLARLEKPTDGEIFIGEKSVEEILKKDEKTFRRYVQMIFQNPYDSFTPRDKIGNILTRPLKIHNIGKDDKDRYSICLKALEEGGLRPADEIMQRYPHQLSGGQLQRISIIRATLLKPKFIIADEPVSMLDISVRADIINALLNLSKQGTSILFISHDIALTRYIADKILVMYLGKPVEYGYAKDVIENPLHPYTKVLISNCASIDPTEEMNRIDIQGEPPTPIDLKPACYFANRCLMATEECFKGYPNRVEVEKEHYAYCIKL
ncbi:MAG: ABC transporter ATP-binding protein [Lagierella massiliensis]|nr:ABC transporter ATP-binding protein [Lagierella massiliensis]